MSLNDYVFRSVWSVHAPAGTVFMVLADLGSYPAWWPEVRGIRRGGRDSAELACRSVLPYTLVFRASREREDALAGVLRARLTGDLDGYCCWRIRSADRADGLTRMTWEQRVTLRNGSLRMVAPFVRPLLRFNHELMMRSGERGLREYLAGDSATR